MKKLPSISKKFSRYTWIIGIIACLVVLAVTIDSEIGLFKRQTAIEICRIYDAARTEVEKFFFQDQTLIRYLIEKAKQQPHEKRIKWLGTNLLDSNEIENFIIVDKKGTIVFLSDPKYKKYLGLNLANLNYINLEQKVSGVHKSFFTPKSVITVGYPFADGTLLVEKDIERLTDKLNKIPRPSIDGSQIFILTKYGRAVYHTKHEFVRTRENLHNHMKNWHGPDAYGFYTVLFDGVRYWCVKKSFNRPQSWYFFAAIPEARIIPYLWHHMWPILVTIFAIFVAIVFLVDFIIKRGISEPLQKLSSWLLELDPMNPESKQELDVHINNLELDSIINSVRKMLDTIKEKNSEILKRDTLFRTVIEYAADWAYWLDESGKFKYNSIKCKEITGYAPEDFFNDPDLLVKIIHEEDREAFKKHLEFAVSDMPHKNMELRIVTKDGRIRWISHNCNKIYDASGNFLGVRGSNLDITDQKMAAAELSKIEKLESLGVIAGGIAHDFNNLLTAILGNLSLAKMEANPSSNLYKRLEASEKATLRAQNLTQQLLTFAKGGSPVKRPSSLKHIILETAEFALKGSNVACKFDFDKDLWLVEVDPGQISQVLHNLILNADQAMSEGGIIKIEAKNVRIEKNGQGVVPPGDYVKITIRDEGHGIPKELLSKIFDPYFTTKEHGSGLGLAVCFSIIRKHGGFITVESSPGKGSCFHIYLPALPSSDSGRDEEHFTSLNPSGNKTILVMDDDPSILQLLTESLKYLGHNTEVARDGKEALEKYKKALESGRPFDAVIMDLTIPGGMGGKETLEKLLQIDPKARVIVSSGYSKDDTITNFRSYGFRASLPKPYKLETLNSVLLSVFSD
ncbi:MAG: PAS domain S-box protein [Thermodesulfobacteria bacterium]|nr:PAS domain S-box protein [Thermodesulfobacteriota bacterium]